jgi:glycosyltransferase involved in cell wall biosynthesis
LSAFETVMRGKRVFGLWNDFELEMSFSRAVAMQLRPDAVVCGSGLCRSWALNEGYPPDRVHTVYHGTDMAKFRPDSAQRAKYRRRYGWTDEFVVLVAARPIPRKRIEDAVDAVAKGSADWPDVRLVLTAPTNRGVDSYVRDLEHRIGRAGLGDRVSWLRGLSVDDMADLTRAADVSVLPAADDGFGIVLIEAMASGVPVITSDVPGHDEIVSETTGALYPLGDVDRLVDAIHTARKGVDPTVVAAARDRVRARFSRERMVAGHLAVYRALIDPPSQGRNA